MWLKHFLLPFFHWLRTDCLAAVSSDLLTMRKIISLPSPQISCLLQDQQCRRVEICSQPGMSPWPRIFMSAKFDCLSSHHVHSYHSQISIQNKWSPTAPEPPKDWGRTLSPHSTLMSDTLSLIYSHCSMLSTFTATLWFQFTCTLGWCWGCVNRKQQVESKLLSVNKTYPEVQTFIKYCNCQTSPTNRLSAPKNMFCSPDSQEDSENIQSWFPC